jgi:hypothetical protein
MMSTSNDRAVADAVAALVGRHDVADALSHVVAGCCASYPADSVAVMARNGHGHLELLGARSYRAEELELLQIQHGQGPCVDAMRSDVAVIAVGSEHLEARWSDVGPAITAAGFAEVHAFPMHWRGATIGALNIFVAPETDTDPGVGQLFADLATLAVLQPDGLSGEQMLARVHDAVATRAVLEQAAGVLAYRLDLDVDAAHVELVRRARAAGLGLTAMAEQVVADQHLGGG